MSVVDASPSAVATETVVAQFPAPLWQMTIVPGSSVKVPVSPCAASSVVSPE